MLWPVPGRLAWGDLFAKDRAPRPGVAKRHSGVDIPAPLGQAFVAPVGGLAEYHAAVPEGQPGWWRGNWVSLFTEYSSQSGPLMAVEEPEYLWWEFLHLAHGASAVTEGQPGEVAVGSLLGYIGSTGASTGPHLHITLQRLIRGRWVLMDPALEISLLPLGQFPFLDPLTRDPLYAAPA